MCKDANGVQLNVGDEVCVDQDFIDARPALKAAGLTDFMAFEVLSVATTLCVVGAGSDWTATVFLSSAGLTQMYVGGVYLTRASPKPKSPYPAPSAPPTSATTATKQLLTHDGISLRSGDLVTITNAACQSWGSGLGLKASDELVCTILPSSHASGCELALDPVDAALGVHIHAIMGSPLYANAREVNFLRAGALSLAMSKAPGVMAAPYQPVLAPPTDTSGEKKPFDHASLGTDLTGDELMESIRAICGGR